ncbi:MAG: endonuclease/exonuclease/phosphatase family protein [Desulfuromonadaceae bacterium]|nr:endonuclease/exonuclease/phosphatase family protein [Desulfuromonadaceae bacterium]
MSNTLRIITYNIHRCIGGDRKISPERISDVIAVHQPDVVALQEVDFGQARPALYDQANIIAESLNFETVWIERERCGNAILSRYPMKMVKAGGLHRPRRWHSLARRGALWVEVEAFGTKIQIIATHLGLTSASRLNQAKVLVGPEWLNRPDCRPPIILCGDFNTQPESTVFRLLEKRLNNVEKLDVNGQVEKTWPSSHPLLSIDHIFISSDIAVETARVPTDGLVQMASDHLPFFVQLSLPGNTD